MDVAYIFLYLKELLPKSNVVSLFGIIEELKSALNTTLSTVLSPIVIVPPNVISPLTLKEPEFTLFNFANVISVEPSIPTCKDCDVVFTYISPADRVGFAAVVPLLNCNIAAIYLFCLFYKYDYSLKYKTIYYYKYRIN